MFQAVNYVIRTEHLYKAVQTIDWHSFEPLYDKEACCAPTAHENTFTAACPAVMQLFTSLNAETFRYSEYVNLRWLKRMQENAPIEKIVMILKHF